MFSLQQLQTLFAFGECATFAVALSEHYKLPIVEIHDAATHDFIHAVVELPVVNNRPVEYLDSYGKSNITVIKNRYDVRNPSLIESNAMELQSVALIATHLMPAANELIRNMIANRLLPSQLKAA